MPMGAMDDLVRRGHFTYESGHHGDTWLELDLLISQPRRLRALAEDLAARLTRLGADLVCGPLTGGAFLAQWIAATLDVSFAYTDGDRLPSTMDVAGRRTVVVDDAINVGHATTAAVTALRAAGGTVIGLASLLVCTPTGLEVGPRLGLPQLYLKEVAVQVWPAQRCPVCAAWYS